MCKKNRHSDFVSLQKCKKKIEDWEMRIEVKATLHLHKHVSQILKQMVTV